MPVAALAVGAIGSSIVGGIASHSAANAQQRAADAATAEQRRQYDLTRQDQQPWMRVGGAAITELGKQVMPGGSLYADFDGTNFQTDPSYQWRLQQGEQALQRSAAARGSVLGGGTLKDLTDYAQGAASQEYQNAFNRFQVNRQTRYNQLAGVAGAGQNSANTLASVGQNTANNIGDNLINAGNARASGYVGMANAFNQGLKGISDLYLARR